MILIGHLTDSGGQPVVFASAGTTGSVKPMGHIRSCYCNDCGEVTLTLE